MKFGAFIFEILPLLVFFAGYHFFGLMAAAALSVSIATIVLGVTWSREGRIAAFPLFSLLMSAVFTAAAWTFDDGVFIKIQPTIFNGLFALVLLGGLAKGRAMMRFFFAHQFSLNDQTWVRLSFRWGWFFLLLAVANETAWRLLDEPLWVAYKTFIAAPATAVFMLAQLPLTLRGRIMDQTDKTGPPKTV